MNNVIKTDFHTFNTSLPFKPLKYFYNCETAASNGFASISAVAAQAPLSPSFYSFTFPISSFVLSSSFKSSSASPVWIRASRHRHSFRRARTASAGLRCQAMTPASLIAPPPHRSQSQRSSYVAAGYLADHAKLMLVLLKPGDYGGFPLCLFV